MRPIALIACLALMVSTPRAQDAPPASGFVLQASMRGAEAIPLPTDVVASGRVAAEFLKGDAALVVLSRPDGCGLALVAGAIPEDGIVVNVSPRTSLAGRVVTPDGKPLAGATVRMTLDLSGEPRGFAGGALRGEKAAPVRALLGAAEMTSGDDGAIASNGICAGDWLLTARAAGWMPSAAVRTRLPASAPADPALPAPPPIVVTMPQGWDPTGVVVEELRVADEVTFAPVAGAEVVARPASAVRGPEATATSDPKGAFALHGFPPGAASLVAKAAGFAGGQAIANAGEPARIVLRRLGSIAFTLADAETGASIAGPADVEILSRSSGGWSPQGEPVRLETMTPCRLADVDPGARALTVRVAGYLPRSVEPFDVASGQERDLGIVALVRGRRVNGRVLDAETEAPVPGATVTVAEHASRLRDATKPRWPVATTGEDGGFALEGLASGELQLLASAEGYADSPAHRVRVTLGSEDDDSRAPLIFRLERPGELLVRVVDRQGAPVPGVKLAATTTWGAWIPGPTERTDAAGEMLFGPMAAGRVTVLRADRAQEPGGGRLAEAVVRAGLRTDALVQEAGVLVRGRVLSGGRPVPALVFVGDFRDTREWDRRAPTYELRDMTPGRHDVTVMHAAANPDGTWSSGRGSTQDVVIVVPDGVAVLEHDIDVSFSEPEAPDPDDEKPATVSGRLVDGDTGAAITLGIWADGSRGGRIAAPSDEQGRFSITLPHAGTWRLMAQVPESQEWWFGPPVDVVVSAGKVVSAPDPLVVTAVRPRRLRLRVVQRTGEAQIPLRGTECRPLSAPYVSNDGTIRPDYGAPAEADALGIVSLRIDSPGSADVVCVVPGLGILIAPGLLPSHDAEPPLLALELAATGSVRIPAGLHDGIRLLEPITGRSLSIAAQPSALLGSLLSFEAGDFVLRGLPPGAWGVSFADGRRTSVVIETGTTADIPSPP